MLKGFRDFILRGNVVDLAVAVVIGASFTTIVNALVSDVITPIIAAIGGTPDFSRLSFSINGSEFQLGHFLSAVISFVIIASVVYFFVVLPINKLLARVVGDPAQKVKKCSECLSKIDVRAKKCKFCTSVQK